MRLLMELDLFCRRIGCFLFGHIDSRVGREAQLCVRCMRLKGRLGPDETLTVDKIMEMRQ